MNIIEALKQGDKIRRIQSENEGVIVTAIGDRLEISPLYKGQNRTRLSKEDILADDWEVVEATEDALASEVVK